MTGKHLIGGGVYILKRAEEIVYVGRTSCFVKRIGDHLRGNDKDFDDFEVLPAPKDVSEELERRLIQLHLPEYNVSLAHPTRENRRMFYRKRLAKDGDRVRSDEEADFIADLIMRVSKEMANANRTAS